MTDLQQMLQAAMARVEAMSIEEFEAECIKAGYTPVRKKPVASTFGDITLESGGVISYRHSTTIRSVDKEGFQLKPANDETFHLAA